MIGIRAADEACRRFGKLSAGLGRRSDLAPALLTATVDACATIQGMHPGKDAAVLSRLIPLPLVAISMGDRKGNSSLATGSPAVRAGKKGETRDGENL